jgi:hypothetical protein
MTHPNLRRWAIWILRGNLVIWAVNAFLLVILISLGYPLNGLVSSDYFSKITLLETGICFLVGGAIAFSGSISSSKTKEYIRRSDEQWSIEKLRRSEKKANKYIALAIILFSESLAVSLLGA